MCAYRTVVGCKLARIPQCSAKSFVRHVIIDTAECLQCCNAVPMALFCIRQIRLYAGFITKQPTAAAPYLQQNPCMMKPYDIKSLGTLNVFKACLPRKCLRCYLIGSDQSEDFKSFKVGMNRCARSCTCSSGGAFRPRTSTSSDGNLKGSTSSRFKPITMAMRLTPGKHI